MGKIQGKRLSEEQIAQVLREERRARRSATPAALPASVPMAIALPVHGRFDSLYRTLHISSCVYLAYPKIKWSTTFTWSSVPAPTLS